MNSLSVRKVDLMIKVGLPKKAFEQVSSWKAYIESMSSGCEISCSGEYAVKHNPPPFYSTLGNCSSNDIPDRGGDLLQLGVHHDRVHRQHEQRVHERPGQRHPPHVRVDHAEPAERHARRFGHAGRQLALHVPAADLPVQAVPERRGRRVRPGTRTSTPRSTSRSPTRSSRRTSRRPPPRRSR